MPLKLPPEIEAALEEAESFIQGFDGDEMQGGVPERILDLIEKCRRLPVPERPTLSHAGQELMDKARAAAAVLADPRLSTHNHDDADLIAAREKAASELKAAIDAHDEWASDLYWHTNTGEPLA